MSSTALLIATGTEKGRRSAAAGREQAPGQPSAWSSYVKVDDADEAAGEIRTWENLPPPWVESKVWSEEEWWDAMFGKRSAGDQEFAGNERRRLGFTEGTRPQRRERPGVRSRQVNVRLTPEDHEALEDAAREYGVATAAMAQLLVNRGLEAVARERSRSAVARERSRVGEE